MELVVGDVAETGQRQGHGRTRLSAGGQLERLHQTVADRQQVVTDVAQVLRHQKRVLRASFPFNLLLNNNTVKNSK